MQKCMDFPEASHYSVELKRRKKKKKKKKTDIKLIISSSSYIAKHKVIFLFSELCLFLSLVSCHTAAQELQSSCILVHPLLITALLIYCLLVLLVSTLIIHSGFGPAFYFSSLQIINEPTIVCSYKNKP